MPLHANSNIDRQVYDLYQYVSDWQTGYLLLVNIVLMYIEAHLSLTTREELADTQFAFDGEM